MRPRLKFHRFNGDVSKMVKIAMIEGSSPERSRNKSMRQLMRLRDRSVMRRQGKLETQVCLLDAR